MDNRVSAPQPLLEVENLTVAFDTPLGLAQAVRGVSFNIREGETLAIVGESGCGKTVLCRNLMRICSGHARVQGHIRFEGTELTGLGEKPMRRIRGNKMAMVFQDPLSSLDPTYPIGRQMVEAIRVHRRVPAGEAKACVLSWLERVGIDRPEVRFCQFPHQLSGGMRQRVVLAMAFINSPRLLIADEPTTALDVTVQAEILALMKKLQRETGVAILLITHDLSVAAMADRICIMYAGCMVEQGTAREVFYDARHPYTWGLLSAAAGATDGEGAYSIAGAPPSLILPPKGDAFAPRNPYALQIDYEQAPPMFAISDTHFAATWLLDARAPRVRPPAGIGNKGPGLEVQGDAGPAV
nr:ABC transporter ATP-binding protein [bacterium]